MNAEITEYIDNSEARGWIFYDAACVACMRGRNRAGRLFESRGFEWVPLQTRGAAARLGVPESAFEFRMYLLTADGRIAHNADALGLLCRSVWWLSPIGVLLTVPGFRDLGRAIYNWFARHRYAFGGECRIQEEARVRVGLLDWLLAMAIPVATYFIGRNFPPWLFMWTLAFGLGLALKWLAWRDALSHGEKPSPTRALAWFLFWPGMDGRAFLRDAEPASRPALTEWVWATGSILIGAALVWLIAPQLLPRNSLVGAWIGMVGFAFLLHFGLIRLQSVFWRHVGVNAEPIMRVPFKAESLTDFWGARWNTAFSIPARRLILLPLARKIDLPMAGLLVFIFSGVLHEIVISLPAHGGFGLPTLYFCVQGAGIAIERSRLGRRWGLDKGLRGWAFVLLFTMAPLFWLFHPVFVNGVMIPFFHAISG